MIAAEKRPDVNNLVEALKQRIETQNDLLPSPTNPFYIVTPAFTQLSAGVKVLHALCHYLNLLGEQAYLVIHPAETVADSHWPYYARFPKESLTNPDLLTPILTQETADLHFRRGLTPITIYPEVFDDPIRAPFIARYILNYPGLLAPKYKTPHQLTVCYSRLLAEYSGAHDVLHIPTVDLEFFYNKKQQRSGTCFYAGKYKAIYGGDPGILPRNSVEILRSDKMSREEIREIFWSSRVFYCYEDTALAIEAALCGCAVSFIPNEHFKNGTIARHELGSSGFAWGDDEEEINSAIQTVHEVEARIRALYAGVPAAIARFAAGAKSQACRVGYEKPVCLPYDMRTVFVRMDPPDEGWRPETRKIRSPLKSFALNWILPPQIASTLSANPLVRRVLGPARKKSAATP